MSLATPAVDAAGFDFPAREARAVTGPADFDFQPACGAALMAVRPGIPVALAIGEAQALLSVVRSRLTDGTGEPLPTDEAYLLGFAVDAALALYHAAGASE